jgi:hypothetical protein
VHWLAHRNTTWSLFACLQYDEEVVLLMFAYHNMTKNTILIVIARNASSSHPRNVTEKILMLSLLAIRQKHAL